MFYLNNVGLLLLYFPDASTYTYDAFVSYKSSEEDEYFVVHTLYPKLEKEMHYKLCLHFRDFIPGESMQTFIYFILNLGIKGKSATT